MPVQPAVNFAPPPLRASPRPALGYEPANVSSAATAASIQAALRAAGGGEVRQLFALYRDLCADSHVQAELQKRKLAVLNQPWSILPWDAEDAADAAAAEAVERLVDDCRNWNDGLAHLLDATVWPLAVVEKVFRPAEAGLRFTLDRLAPVNPVTFCLRATGPGTGQASDANAWEPDLRFYRVTEDGRVETSAATATPADPARHVVHRGHLMAGQRDNWGGPLRGVVFWWLLRNLGREYFGRTMERFGVPFIAGHVDARDKAAVEFLQEQFSLSTKIGGLVVDEATRIELKEIALSGAADAHERFITLCNREISVLIVGQSLSAKPEATGLGSGVAALQGEVRADIRQWDAMKLGETLRWQVFMPFLRYNGLAGRAPRIVWGGDSPAEIASTADLLVKLNQAGLEPTDAALPSGSEKVGYELQRKAPPPAFGLASDAAGDGRSPRSEARMEAFAARGLPGAGADPTDPIVRARTAALARAYRGSLAPFRQAVLESATPEAALARLRTLYADWSPARVADELETALQIATAAGAAAGVARDFKASDAAR